MSDLERTVDRVFAAALRDRAPSEELDRRIDAALGARPRWHMAVAAVTLLVVAAGAVLAVLGPRRAPTEVATTGGSSVRGWDFAKQPPIAVRDEVGTVWTGREVIVWGGKNSDDDSASNEGAAYDPKRRRWRRIADAPIEGRVGHATVWTGREMLVWGGKSGSTRLDGSSDGAAYDPVADRWRRIPDAPIAGGYGHVSGWTGREMFVWGRTAEDGYATEGAAYDPAADRWRLLPPLPGPRTSRPVLLVVPGGVIAFDRLFGTDPRAVTGIHFFDESSGTWINLPRSPVSRLGYPTPVVIDGGLAVVGADTNEVPDALHEAGLYDFGERAWRPIAAVEGAPEGGWLGQFVPLWAGPEIVTFVTAFDSDGRTSQRAYAYNRATDRWRELPPPPARPLGTAHWTGSAVVAWTERGLLVSR